MGQILKLLMELDPPRLSSLVPLCLCLDREAMIPEEEDLLSPIFALTWASMRGVSEYWLGRVIFQGSSATSTGIIVDLVAAFHLPLFLSHIPANHLSHSCIRPPTRLTASRARISKYHANSNYCSRLLAALRSPFCNSSRPASLKSHYTSSVVRAGASK
ncbi:hypothetical protein BD289DRAFT_260162 [Coniella lustricola]|uniref:Uncharacterized protein n=1 Tax=Coniella lustricola TaxID=2025994 RepID=A0A2T3A7X8_9PEZI|nr:hypothetical protein BD289DRAFT_260162 [Coniella lustricola]